MRTALPIILFLAAGAVIAGGSSPAPSPAPRPAPTPPASPAPNAGGDAESRVQVANLIYAGVKSSHCFSDHFLTSAEKNTSISTNRRFHAVKLASDDIFGFPLVIMTGEGDFVLSSEERTHLKRYLEQGGFLMASAGCSSTQWDDAFLRELAAALPGHQRFEIPMSHPVFHTAKDIETLQVRHGTVRPFTGVEINGRLAVLYSPDGLNDTSNATGCCCCGGNEILNAEEVNVNVLAYALSY